MINSIVTGTGMYMPEFVLNNEMFNQVIETSDEWIISRTGIKERRLEQKKYNYEMIGEACKLAVKNAGITPDKIDMMIVSTVTPDYSYPSTACLVQGYIGAVNAAAFDIAAACAGFVFALDMADLYIKSGKAKNILVASGDIVSRTVDYHDRANCILFGDGSGAAVLSANTSGERRGVITSFIKSEADGDKPFAVQSPLYRPQEIFDSETKIFKGSAEKLHGSYMSQNGREVYQFVVRILPKILEEAANKAGVEINDFDYIVLHQANKRILDYVVDKYKLNPEKVPINIEKYGNTSSSTVPVTLHELNMAGKLKRGDLIALAGFGSGLAYGAAVVEW